MMKYSQALWTGLAVVLVLPAFSQEDGEKPAGLQQALQDTLSVLNELGGLQHSLEKGDTRSIGRLLELTESPIFDAPARDQRLTELRNVVSDLQMRVDTTASSTPHSTPWSPGSPPGTSEFNIQALGRLATPSSVTKPSPASGATPPLTSLEQPHTSLTGSSPTSNVADQSSAPEPIGYSADVMRQARLLIRSAHYAEALTLLEHTTPSAEVQYLRARASEQLGQVDTAIALYQEVSTSNASPEFAARAQQDLSFLQWKRDMQAISTKKSER